jgi:spermidine synthase
VGDGRNFLVYRSARYGIIVSEPPDIWVAGVASLFSHEFYESVKQHLSPSGIFCQWVPLYHLRTSTIRLVYRTLRRSFRYVHVFVLANGNSIVLASDDELSISMDRLEERSADPEASQELARADIRFAVQLLALLALNPAEVDVFAGEGAIHTDDSGRLEFAAQSDYLFSVRRRGNSQLLKRELKEAFEPFGDLAGLRIDVGSGERAELRRRAIAAELLRAGRVKQAEHWRSSGSN